MAARLEADSEDRTPPTLDPAMIAARDHAALAAALDPIVTIDSHGVIQSASDSIERVFGWRPEELVGRSVNVLMPEPYRSEHDASFAEFRRTGRTNILGRAREFEGLRRNGERFPIEISVSRVDPPGCGPPLFVGILRDISRSKRLEGELRLVQDLALAIANAPTVAHAMTEALRLICLATRWDCGESWIPSARGEEIVNGAHWMRPGSGLERFSLTGCASAMRRGMGLPGRAWSSGQPIWVSDLSRLSPPDFCRPGEARAAGLRAAAAVPVPSGPAPAAVLLFFVRETRPEDARLLELVCNATVPLATLIQHKQAEESLRESEERLRLALRSARGAAWDWDLVSGEAVWSPEMYELWGIAPGTPMRMENSLAVVHEEDRVRVRAEVDDAVRRGADYHCEFRILHSVLGERWVMSHARLVIDNAGRPRRLLGITLDITERKGIEKELGQHRERLEHLVAERTTELRVSHERLRIADRLASLGTLAAGLGHDMNNVLLPVRAHLNALRAAAKPAGPSTRRHLDAIARSTKYLQQLADGLHFLAVDPESPDGGGESTILGRWWTQTGALLAKAAPRHVTVRASISSRLPAVAVAAPGLTQAVLNLVVNAGEAIPRGRKRTQGTVRVAARLNPAGDHVRLSVSDNGVGMSEEVRRRAFDMFFTTKRRGLGTGLGLPLVRKVAESAGGAVEIDSRVGTGTTVTLVLPVARSPAPATAPGRARRSARVGSVVITIDDGRAAAMVRHLVETLGGRADAASEPGDADVWIVQPTAARSRTARAWLTRRLGRRLVLIGAPEAEHEAVWNGLNPLIVSRLDDYDALRSAVIRALRIPRQGEEERAHDVPERSGLR